jgi:hypothetical protein
MNTTNADRLGGRLRRLPDEVHLQATFHRGENERAGRPHGAAFGRGCDADEDRPEHEEDQEQRRHHHERDLLGHAREETEAEHPLACPVQDGDRKGEQNAEEHRQNDEIGAGLDVAAHHDEQGDDAGDRGKTQEIQPGIGAEAGEPGPDQLVEEDNDGRAFEDPPQGVVPGGIERRQRHLRRDAAIEA